MGAWSTYSIKFNGKKESVKMVTELLSSLFGAHLKIKEENEVAVNEERKYVWVEDISNQLAVEMVKAASDVEFVIQGTVDTSEQAGEYMDFIIEYKNQKLTERSSCWYVENIEGIEDFFEESDDWDEKEIEDNFERFMELGKYILDSGDGEIVDEVPLDEPVEIEIPDAK